MNLVTMLQQTVTPLSAYNARREPDTYNTEPANGVRASTTKLHYMDTMKGKGWMTTNEVDVAAGYKRGAASKWLLRALVWGYVEQRPVGGTYNKQRGYEWRWK